MLGLSVSRPPEGTTVVLPRGGQGGPSVQGVLLGAWAAAYLDRLLELSHKRCRSPVPLGLNMDEDPVQMGRNHRRTRGTFRAQANNRGRQGALQRTGELRGPNRLGSLAMPGLPRRAFRLPSSVKTIQRTRSRWKTL